MKNSTTRASKWSVAFPNSMRGYKMKSNSKTIERKITISSSISSFKGRGIINNNYEKKILNSKSSHVRSKLDQYKISSKKIDK